MDDFPGWQQNLGLPRVCAAFGLSFLRAVDVFEGVVLRGCVDMLHWGFLLDVDLYASRQFLYSSLLRLVPAGEVAYETAYFSTVYQPRDGGATKP